MNSKSIFRALSFFIGSAMLIASFLIFFGVTITEAPTEVPTPISSILGLYFVYFGLTGKANVIKLLKAKKS